MSFQISIKKFRAEVDLVEDKRVSTMIKTAYLLAARNSEILTKTAPWDLLHNASKPYGQFLKFRIQEFETTPQKEDEPTESQKVLVITSAVAKRGKNLKPKKQETTIEVTREEVKEALLRYNLTKLLAKWQAGEVEIDPLLIKVLQGKITLKVVALPTNKTFEPWTLDLLKWISKHGNINFNLTRQRLWQLLRENLPKLLQKKSSHNIKNPLRHFRVSHLIEYYAFDPYELTSYTGWTAKSTFGQLGIQASPNIDAYSHLRWRMYFPKLLKPIDKFR